MKLLVIGAGNMGSAMVKALLKRSDPLFDSIEVLSRSPEKAAAVEQCGAKWVRDWNEVHLETSDMVLVAVKPQDIDGVLEILGMKLRPENLLVSVAAGVSLERLQSKSDHGAVVRVMPNTPTLIGEGASGWIASPEVTASQKSTLETMLETFGIAMEVEHEDHMDAVTALSGSGPAYVFYFLEALVEGAMALGLSQEQAHGLALQTVLGAAELAMGQAVDLEGLKTLRAQVTSKGGTTERAIGVFDSQGLKSLVKEAMKAAYVRAKEL